MSPELREQIEAVCKKAPRNDVCYFGTLRPDGKFRKMGHTACHAGVSNPYDGWNSYDHSGAEYILSVTQHKTQNPDREAGIAYLAWLCGPTGPHRLIAKDFNPDPEFAFDNGVILGDLGTAPKNLVQHFFVATRLATEQKGAVERWKLLVDAGVHPALAFIGVYEQGSGGYNGNHSAMPSMFTEEWVLNWANGTPVNLDPKVWAEPGPHTLSTDEAFGKLPRCVKWGHPPKYDRQDYWESIQNLYPSLLESRTVSSPWGVDLNLPACPGSEEDLITILKAEQERLGLES